MLRKMKAPITNSIITLIGGLFLLFGVYLSYRFYWAYSLIFIGAIVFSYALYRICFTLK